MIFAQKQNVLKGIKMNNTNNENKKKECDLIPISWLKSIGMTKIDNDFRPQLFKLIKAWEDWKEEQSHE